MPSALLSMTGIQLTLILNQNTDMTIAEAYILHKNSCLLNGEQPMTELEFIQFANELIDNHKLLPLK